MEEINHMKSKSPLFTIVMPTRNRAHILPNALRSALDQTFDDYEIVIMANNCHDNTREVVESLATSRVRYYETDQTLSMPDNWEYAWTKAEGKYITYLSDDDALIPTALELLAEKALDGSPPVVSWEDAIYYYPSKNDQEDQQNLLLLNYFGSALIEEVDSTALLEQLAKLEFSWTASIPKMNNSAVNRAFWDERRKQLGRIFFPLAPDYSFAWIATQICQSIRIVRSPLSVRGISEHSIGSDANLGKAGQDFFKEFGEINFFSDSPIDLPTSMNIIFATFSQINQAFKNAGLVPKQVDRKALICALAKQVAEFRHLLPEYKKYADRLIENAQKISDEFEEIVETIISSKTVLETVVSATEIHISTRKSNLAYLPYLKREVLASNHDLPSAFCKLGLRDDSFAEANWSCIYVFGDALGIHNIYEISKQVNHYYALLAKNRNRETPVIQRKSFPARVFHYAKRKLYLAMNLGISTI